MNTIDILFIACLLLLYFLPKKSDNYKYYRIIPIVIFFIAIGIRIHSKIEGHKNTEKINDLNLQINAQEEDLTKKDQKIKELEQKAKLASRGVVSRYKFNGDYMYIEGGSFKNRIGKQSMAFQELMKLTKELKFTELINLASQEIKETPEWLTPYFLRGVAYIDINQFDKGIADLKYVVQHADDDPNYKIPNNTISALKRAGYDPNQLLDLNEDQR